MNPYFEKARAPEDTWQIVVGLIPGYAYAKSPALRAIGAILHHLGELAPFSLRDKLLALAGHVAVVRVFDTWRKSRAEAGLPFVTGFAEFKEVRYTSRNAGGSWVNACEPVAVLQGNRNPLHDRDDAAYTECVIELARKLAERFRQRRVYVNVGGETTILQRKD
jgi:hypothetical protein